MTADSLRTFLVRSASGSFGLNVANVLLKLGTGIVLARALGASGYGVYAYAFAWLQILQIPAAMGLPSLIVRNVAVYVSRQQWGLLRGLLVRANQAALLASLVLGLAAATASWLLASDASQQQFLDTFLLALCMLPFMALTALRAATLRGLHLVILGQMPEAVVGPVIALALVGGAWWLWDTPLSPLFAVGMQLTATVCAFTLGAALLLWKMPAGARTAAPAYDTKIWSRSVLPFLLIGGIQVFNNQVGILILGVFEPTAEVGIYRVASLAAGLILFGLAAANAVLSPVFARLYAEGAHERLQRLITLSARAILAFSAPLALVLMLFGSELLALLFGAEYASGGTALTILAGGQLFNAAMGSIGILLNMTGFERDSTKGVALAAIVNGGLCMILIPAWGINGAATAMTASLLIWNIVLAVYLWRRTGLHATALGRIRR